MKGFHFNLSPSSFLLKILYDKLNNQDLTTEERKDILLSIKFLSSLGNRGDLKKYESLDLRIDRN